MSRFLISNSIISDFSRRDSTHLRRMARLSQVAGSPLMYHYHCR